MLLDYIILLNVNVIFLLLKMKNRLVKDEAVLVVPLLTQTKNQSYETQKNHKLWTLTPTGIAIFVNKLDFESLISKVIEV